FMTPLFLTGFGSILGAFVTAYISAKIFYNPPVNSQLFPLSLFISSCTIITLLNDRAPWQNRLTTLIMGEKIRNILILFLSFSSIVSVSIALLKINSFSYWTDKFFGFSIPYFLLALILSCLMILWVLISLDIKKHFFYPLAFIPTSLAILFVTDLPVILLIIPYTACLALMLATADKRFIKRQA
ncbi:MAG: hypothetical protein HQK54_00970, partial [Oligoflexales bacterium]|nr:hypothetical protein [Oligoflexales bacterium]